LRVIVALNYFIMETYNQANLFDETAINVQPDTRIVPPTRRVRRCGHCRQEGHDRRTCPDPEQVERRRVHRVANEIRYQQRLQEIRRMQGIRVAASEAAAVAASAAGYRVDGQPMPEQSENRRTPYKLYNNNNYSVRIYWTTIATRDVKYLQNISDYSEKTINAYPTHRFVFIPEQEFLGEEAPRRGDIINMATTNKFIAGDFNLMDFDDHEITIIREYKLAKSELEQWKECGLKSLFLLKELERMGATNYDNLEPIMDMIQDVPLPQHTELDKEQAGIPSTFTNIT
jgi:hypothetical protein